MRRLKGIDSLHTRNDNKIWMVKYEMAKGKQMAKQAEKRRGDIRVYLIFLSTISSLSLHRFSAPRT